MSERIKTDGGWKRVKVGEGHYVLVRTIDPKIQAKMPTETRNFMQVGFVEFAINEAKRALGIKK